MFEESIFGWPRISEETIERVSAQIRKGGTSFDLEAFESFEADLAARFGVAHALVTCNGTSAALSAFHAIGLGPGTELIAPAYSHWATALPATQLGCKVVFADIERDSLSIDLKAVQGMITRQTRAVVVCHLYGNPVNLLGIRQLCDEAEIALVEDASHAPGAEIAGMKVGAVGDVSFLSLQASKPISGGEAGALLTNDPELHARATILGHPKRIFRLPKSLQQHDRVGLGYKLRPSPLAILIAHDSLRDLTRVNRVRSESSLQLRQRLAEIEALSFPTEIEGARRTYFRNDLLLSERFNARDLAQQLLAEGLNVESANYDVLPDLPQFGAAASPPTRSFPNARTLLNRLLLVQPQTQFDQPAVARYAAALQNALKV